MPHKRPFCMPIHLLAFFHHRSQTIIASTAVRVMYIAEHRIHELPSAPLPQGGPEIVSGSVHW